MGVIWEKLNKMVLMKIVESVHIMSNKFIEICEVRVRKV